MDTEKIHPAQGEGQAESLRDMWPLPWAAEFPEVSSGYWYVNDVHGREVATCYDGGRGAEERAKLIARAVNCHDALVAALRLAVQYVPIPEHTGSIDPEAAKRGECRAEHLSVNSCGCKQHTELRAIYSALAKTEGRA